MSYDVSLYMVATDGEESDSLFWANHTRNTSRMWRDAGVDLVEYAGKSASDLIEPLAAAIQTITGDPVKYRAMEPKNRSGPDVSAHRSWHIWCDGCDEGTPNPDHSRGTAEAARREARGQGWTNRGGSDWCPRCSHDGTRAANIRASSCARR